MNQTDRELVDWCMEKKSFKMPKVSVIIPMYNAEEYIWQCLQSVMNQIYRELEIIVIDDGSTDRSLEICRELYAVDNRIKILVQENRGVSSARNKGLEAASGKYVLFVDSDDAIHPSLIHTYVKQGEKDGIELMFCNCIMISSLEMEKKIKKTSGSWYEVKWKTAKETESREWFYKKYNQELHRIGGKMIRFDFIEDQRFDERLFIGEDTVFMYNLICRNICMACLERGWYYYRVRADSITHVDNSGKIRQKYRASKIMRNQEYQLGQMSGALKCEEVIIWNMLSDYLIAKNKGDKRNIQKLKDMIIKEMENPLYKNISCRLRVIFSTLFFGCSYIPPFRILWRIKQKLFPFP